MFQLNITFSISSTRVWEPNIIWQIYSVLPPLSDISSNMMRKRRQLKNCAGRWSKAFIFHIHSTLIDTDIHSFQIKHVQVILYPLFIPSGSTGSKKAKFLRILRIVVVAVARLDRMTKSGESYFLEDCSTKDQRDEDFDFSYRFLFLPFSFFSLFLI